MKNKINGFFSIILALCCCGVTFFALFKELFGVSIGFGFATIVFSVMAILFFENQRLFVNEGNSLSLIVTDVSKIKHILRNNLVKNGFELNDGFYVNKKHKNFDIYFTTYNKDNLSKKSAVIAQTLECNSDFLDESLKVAGYYNVPDQQEEVELFYKLSGMANSYNNPNSFDDKKRSIVIFVNFDDVDFGNKKRMYYIGLVPFHRHSKFDALSMIEFDTANKSANLATSFNSKDIDSRIMIKTIFKDVISFN